MLKIEYMALKDIHPYERNPRKNDEAVEYVAKSIQEFGFKIPIIIDEHNTIVCGHTRYRAVKKLNYTEVPCIRADDLTPDQIKSFRIIDNKTAEIAEWDFAVLWDEIKSIDFDFGDFGFSPDPADDIDMDNLDAEETEEPAIMKITLTTKDAKEYEKIRDEIKELIKGTKISMAVTTK